MDGVFWIAGTDGDGASERGEEGKAEYGRGRGKGWF